MKTVAILGSTGSIGKNALKVIAQLEDRFKVVALSAGSSAHLLARQVNRFRPRLAAIMDETKFSTLKNKVDIRTKLCCGPEAIEEVASCGADIVVMAIGGSAALLPVLRSLEKSKRLALANKECLVMAGDIIMRRAKKRGVEIIPVDSEHSAIFQCLKDEERSSLDKIYLTGSGGPLKDTPKEELGFVQPDFALRHPLWKMGKKISIDSATLMNKGLEVIEAKYLFGLDPKKIKVLIHPEAVVHSLVEFCDGTILAQLGKTDMRLPIQYALSYPQRFVSNSSKLDFSQVSQLSFSLPDLSKFPCLRLAQEAAEEKGLAETTLNACDEECVWAYLEGKIKINDIARIISRVLAKLKNNTNPTLPEILQADKWARDEVRRWFRY
ncbi:MAG: 1-deoxy-D-xylulose-5-phosphate reductoisomerase [Omnitrophica bacterium]|nr:1-deoxy-D-xylulose-5-phosphate reductoisomerase [Candidatus Omnitrophota bacterium]